MKAFARNVRGRQRSKLQASYAQHLDLLKLAGEIHDYREEALTLRLGPDLTWRPDFLVIEKDLGIAIHETKGHMEQHARAKIIMAAELFPWFSFYVVRWKDKQWQSEKI